MNMTNVIQLGDGVLAELRRQHDTACEEVNSAVRRREELKLAAWTAEKVYNNAEKSAKAAGKKAHTNAKIAWKETEDLVKITQDQADRIHRDILEYDGEQNTVKRSQATEANVLAALEKLNAYYISTESAWHCVYTNHERFAPQVKAVSNETMRDMILGETGWTETNDLTVKQIAQKNGRMFRDVERTFLKPQPTVLNQMNELRKFWLKPVFDQQPHEAFDLLFNNLVGGDPEYQDQIERYIAYSYVKPEDIFAPNIDSSARGGVGRDTVFRILEIIFTEACCGEAKRETVQGTHNGELWGKVWVKVSESNSRAMDINELKNLTGGHNYRHREMGKNAVQLPRTFRFFMMSNNYSGTARLAGTGSGAEDRRWEPVFSKTSLSTRIADRLGLDIRTDHAAISERLQDWQHTVWQNEAEIAVWLGHIIQKHEPQHITKLQPLHGEYYQQMLERQKNAFNVFMQTIVDLGDSTNCYSIDDLAKIYRIVTGQTQDKHGLGKRMCEWMINATGHEWEIRVRNIYKDEDDDRSSRIRRQVVCLKEAVVIGRPATDSEPTKLVFNVYDFIEPDAFDDKGNSLGRRPHVNNIKGDLL